MDIPLENIQPNILKAHGRNYTHFLFLEFKEDIEASTLSNLLYQLSFFQNNDLQLVINAQEQLANTINYNQQAIQGQLDTDHSIVLNIHFTHSGLQKIRPTWKERNDQFFHHGMRDYYSVNRLCDPPVKEWEDPFQRDIDCMFSCASDNLEILSQFEKLISPLLNQLGKLITLEKGQKMMRGKDAIEPFGFKDNISNPCFFDKQQDKKYVPLWDQFNLVLNDQGGSYLVFRKLKQHVDAFEEMVNKLAQKLGISKAYAEAQIVGRFKDGTPLVLGENPELVPSQAISDFDLKDQEGYHTDPTGLKCPFHAHTRRSNPREDRIKHWDKSYAKRLKIIQDESKLAYLEVVKKRFGRIVRRGIPFKEKDQVGLHFLCYQRSIADQFVVVQKGWCNEPNLKSTGQMIGIDPLVGQYHGPYKTEFQNTWHHQWNATEGMQTSFDPLKEVVTFKGGAYFYTPSIPELRRLNDQQAK